MNLIGRIGENFKESAQTKLDASELLAAPIARAVEMMVGSLLDNGKILICGNGGSAADAQHMAAELVGRGKEQTIATPEDDHETDYYQRRGGRARRRGTQGRSWQGRSACPNSCR